MQTQAADKLVAEDNHLNITGMFPMMVAWHAYRMAERRYLYTR